MYNMISDPGHGWLSVSHKEVLDLGLEDKISPYSYMNGTRVFLEEDRDANLFIEAKGLTQKDIRFKYVEKTFIRSLARYNKVNVGKVLTVGTCVILKNGTKTVIDGETKNRLYTLYGSFSKSNPFLYVDVIS